MKDVINNVNWPEKYPDKPEVKFSLKADGNILKIHFSVKEDETVARATHNFDEVWKDSCCELFIMFDGEDKYYNIETSCNGYQLLSYRPGRENPENAPAEVMDSIRINTSLKKHAAFGPCHVDKWTLDIEIPAEAFWRSDIKDFSNVRAKGNVYKCNERLERRHFISWAPISTPEPDFHRPEFFQSLDLR